MHDGVYITDNRGNTLFINDAYTRMSGLKKEEVIGNNLGDLISRGFFLESASLKVIERDEPVTIVDKFRNGKRCLITSSPVHDENGKIIMVITNLRDMTELIYLKKKLDQAEEEMNKYSEQLRSNRLSHIESKFIGHSKEIKDIKETIEKISDVDATVLIYGETGVGKEVVAQRIHRSSNRWDKPFIRVNCASIPETLFESELFGYEKGAFTGASSNGKPGFFELADKGTILLDEIGEIPLNIQSKLLRVIQEKEITRIGGTISKNIDVRILAATNGNLQKKVKRGLFREDLYYRLNVIPIFVPPLRERKDDIELLASYFLDIYNKDYNKEKKLEDTALRLLRAYSWPGNVRELKNVVERMVLICSDDIISSESILKINDRNDLDKINISYDKEITLDKAVASVEKQLIERALKSYGTTRKAAEKLDVSQPTIVRKAHKYGINLRT